ncbi:uncharacterized protein LOC110007387 isoform X1 [Amborella trichopoda]|uniref:Uncharacterized protein n=2 Tax=Amborella trichopoda TaxID=13333 RepID=W1PIF7_AMBTC|nr:uncharacterized protein LOC110007387 isoform X1 [Amborella trichopoda]ERN07509.1 hypothetical protein AMTR_s00154p00015750 [Amborella trichopoda]|eukprot:XP_020523813.1 uncharacterized protein LOC110007387 isoform X1 [Amborella trichopoda]
MGAIQFLEREESMEDTCVSEAMTNPENVAEFLILLSQAQEPLFPHWGNKKRRLHVKTAGKLTHKGWNSCFHNVTHNGGNKKKKAKKQRPQSPSTPLSLSGDGSGSDYLSSLSKVARAQNPRISCEPTTRRDSRSKGKIDPIEIFISFMSQSHEATTLRTEISACHAILDLNLLPTVEEEEFN